MVKRSLLLLLAGIWILPGSAQAKVFYSKEGALRVAFPGATQVSHKNIILSTAQWQAASRLSQSKLPSKLIRVYVASKKGRPIAYGFISAPVLRTQRGVFLTVITADGRVSGVHVLAFHEPLEYMPTPSWLGQFRNKRLDRKLAIDGIAGSTMTAGAVGTSIRQVLAVHRVLFPVKHQLSKAR